MAILEKVFNNLKFISIMLLIIIVGCNNEDDVIIPHIDSELSNDALLTELNFARINPKEYAKIIEATLPYYNGNYLKYPDDTIIIITQEGKYAV